MSTPQTTHIAILGGGKGGTALLDLLTRLPEVVVIGVADKDPSATGVERAREQGLIVTTDVVELIDRDDIDLIVDVTGDPTVEPLVAAHKRPPAEVLSGAAARLLWNIVQHQAEMQSQLFSAEKLASIGTFASGLAHDINNPLYLILGTAEHLLDEKDPDVIRQQTREILDAVQRVSALTKELTQYARHSSPSATEDVDLSLKMDEALRIARYASVLLDVNVVKDYAAKPLVKSNPEEILHVFVNLMTNAIHAMNGKGTLTLATSWVEDRARVSISDTGCGIPKENLAKIFEPFFTTKPPGKGTGLGLHNVIAIVKKLNGQVSVESEAGKGTTFILDFPKT